MDNPNQKTMGGFMDTAPNPAMSPEPMGPDPTQEARNSFGSEEMQPQALQMAAYRKPKQKRKKNNDKPKQLDQLNGFRPTGR